ncbi:hypothetical protein DFH28DRAFT_913111 [Melampsora americana]|nr:hypothetical protein DFH28DRAFT_913111 [Melampsora americana]
MATPSMVPLDPSKALPPIIKGKCTGVICKSPNCFDKEPHSTVYYEPTKQPNAPLIGIRCPYRNYCRSYFRSIYHSALTKHNSQFNRDKKRKRGDQTSQDHNIAMELHNMLNGDDVTSFNMLHSSQNNFLASQHNGHSTPAGEGSESLTLSGQCRGDNGRTAEGHSNRRNNMCPMKACFECCDKLNKNRHHCVPHSAQARSKKNKSTFAPTQESTSAATSSSTTTNSQVRDLPRQGGGETYKRQVDQLNVFRTLGIRKQAEERQENQLIGKAMNTVTMVVWAGCNIDPVECEIWREYIPNWPRFALEQSEDLMEIVQRDLGKSSNPRVLVWSNAEGHWIGLRLSIIETYPEDCRRILIRFPSVAVSKCKDIDQQVALANSFLHKRPDLNIVNLVQPDEGCPPLDHLGINTQSSKSKVTLTPTPPSSPLEDLSSPNATPELQVISAGHFPHSITPSPEIQIIRTGYSTTKTPENRQHSTSSGGTDPKWPSNISMRLMTQYYNLSIGPNKLTIPAAWNKIFGGKGWTFVFSTASLYRRWLDLCNQQGLQDFLAENPYALVHDGINHFDVAWKQCNTKKSRVAAPKQSPT